MWHVKAHSLRLPCPGKFSRLTKIPVGCCTNHPLLSSPSLTLIYYFAWQLSPQRFGGGAQEAVTSSVPWISVQKSSFSFPRAFPFPTVQCHVVCCGLHPDNFLGDGAGVLQGWVICGKSPVCSHRSGHVLLRGNTHCLLG